MPNPKPGLPAARVTDGVAGGIIIQGEETVLIGGTAKPVACKECKAKELQSQGNPVNVQLGCKFEAAPIDFAMAAPLPFVWQRFYASDTPWVGLLGQGWRTPVELHVEADAGATRLVDIQGRTITFASLAAGEEQHSPSEGVWIARGTLDQDIPWDERWQWLPRPFRHDPNLVIVTAGDGDYLIFDPVIKPASSKEHPGPAASGHYDLRAMLTRHGYVTKLTWTTVADAQGHPVRFPEWVTDSAGRIFRLHHTVLPEQLERQWSAHHPHPDNGLRLAGVSLAFDPFDGQDRSSDFASLRQKAAMNWLVQYRYSREGDLVQVLDGSGDTSVEFGYERHLMTRKRTPDGRDVSYQYDRLAPEGKVIRQIQAGGLTLDFAYDAEASSVTDSLGRTTRYRFEGQAGLRRLVELQRPDGSLIQMSYTADGQISAVVDPLGRKTHYTHTAQGEYLGSINALGHREESFLDHRTGLMSGTRNAEGRSTHFERDDLGNITQIVASDGNKTRFEYGHPQFPDRPTVIIDARGGQKHLQYNALGQLHTRTDCSGQATHYLRDSVGHLQAIETANGQRQTYRRDKKGRITAIEFADGRSEAFHYDQSGRLVKAIDPQGRPVEMRYDRYGRMTEHRIYLGEPSGDWSITVFEYDAAGHLIKLTNPQGAVMGFAYDEMDRLTLEIGFDGKRSTYAYNLAGELIEQTDGTGSTDAVRIRHEHDALGRMTARHIPEWNGSPAQIQRFDYNKMNKLVSATTHESRVDFAYNLLGQLIAETQSSADGFSQTLRYGYDALGNRNQLVLPDGQSIDTLMYGSGHWHQIAFNGHPLVDVERDALHREIKRTYGSGSANLVAHPMQRTLYYTATGELDSYTWSRGDQLIEQRKHHYDLSGMLIQIDRQLDNARELVRYAYDMQQRLTAWDLHEVIHQPATLDNPAGKPAFKQRHKQTYAYDKASNPIQPGAVMRTDPVSGQAMYATPEQWAQQVKANLDKPGFEVLGQDGARANRMAQLDDVAYQYDERGNVVRRKTSEGNWDFGWDALNQMTVSRFTPIDRSDGVYAAAYFYDAFGRRIGKRVMDLRAMTALPNGEANPDSVIQIMVRYLWDQNQMLQEVHEAYTKTIVYEPQNFTPVAQITQGRNIGDSAVLSALLEENLTNLIARSNESQTIRHDMSKQIFSTNAASAQIHFFLTDHLGTPVQMLKAATHETVWARAQDPLGNTLKEITDRELDEECIPSLRFQGQQYDWETTLYYNRYRFFDAKARRYISQDPIGLNGGLNYYAYPVNPVQWIDPTGRQASAPAVQPAVSSASQPAFGIGIEANNSAAYKNGVHQLLTDTGHTLAYVRDENGKITCALSVGPGTPISMNTAKDFRDGKIPGRTNWPATEPIRAFESPMTPDQYSKCQAKCEEHKQKPIMYSPQYQCTSAALALAKDCGISMPSGVGPVEATVMGITAHKGDYANPYQLDAELSKTQTPVIYPPNTLQSSSVSTPQTTPPPATPASAPPSTKK